MNKLKKYSISKRLTISLIMTVGIVATIAILAIYFNAKRLALHELEKKADETISYLVGALKIPLWQVNKDSVNLIGKSVIQNEIIVKLQISDESGIIIYNEEKEPDNQSIKKTGKIHYQNEYLGEVKIHVTKRLLHKNSRNLLISYFMISLLVFSTLVLVTDIFIRKFLQKPLIALNKIADSYMAGEYDSEDSPLPYLELEPFRNVLKRMRETISGQMKDLKNAEEKYRSIFDNAVEGIYQTTLDGKFITANPSTAKIFGYDNPDDLIQNVTDIRNQLYVNPSQRDEMYKFEHSDIVTGFEVEIYRKDKKKIWVSFNTRAVRGSNGEILFLEGFVGDITERKKAEKEKQRLEAQFYQAQRMEALGTLAGGIAHDFNNLLMGIQGRNSLLLMALDPSHHAVDHLKFIESYVKSASDLTKQLLGLARGGKYEVKTTDINRLVENSSKMFGRTKKEIQIHRKLYEPLWTVEVDRGQMDQVLLNLFVNAWQAMPEGGDLYIETQNAMISETDAQIYSIKPGRYVILSITDTGTGIDKNILGKIFDPFFSTKGIGRGTGLGLASAYGIITNHDGTIIVDSKIGEGSTFNIYLPASEQ